MQEQSFEQLIDRIASFIKDEARTETVVGDSFTLGEYECIPVIRVGLGFGTGGGEGDDEKDRHGTGMGAGAGMGIDPIGFLVARGDEISFVSTRNNKGLASTFEKVPELLAKFLESREAKEMAG
ncbi:MAG: sporulation protein [Saprospiraceae bacterium]|nr:sporulation protein [Saprospiraceae bacterium]